VTVADACEGVIVQADAVAARRPDLRFEELPAGTLYDLGAHDRGVAAGAHQRRVGDTAERRARGCPRDGLQQARLSLGVRTDDDRDPRRELEIGLLVATEVAQPEPREPRRGVTVAQRGRRQEILTGMSR
jgi:hypothetical protein